MTDQPAAPRDLSSGTPEYPSVTAEISERVVEVHTEYYGHGPAEAKTIWRDNLVVVVLKGVFTRAERTLVGAGHFDQVRASRQAFQDEIEPTLRTIVEEATGRHVRSSLRQVNDDGIAAAVFLLGP